MTQWDHFVLTNKRLAPVLSGRAHFKMAASKAFSSPEATVLLVSTKNRDHWPVPICWACSEYSFCVLSQSDLTFSPRFADLRFWNRPEVLILGAAGPKGSWPLGTRMRRKSLSKRRWRVSDLPTLTVWSWDSRGLVYHLTVTVSRFSPQISWWIKKVLKLPNNSCYHMKQLKHLCWKWPNLSHLKF